MSNVIKFPGPIEIKPADLEAIAQEIWDDEVGDAVQSLMLVQSCLESLANKDWEVLLEAGKQFSYWEINRIVRKIVMKSEGRKDG